MAKSMEIPHPTTAPPYLIHQKVQIAAPPSLVFSLLTDLSTWPTWNGFLTGSVILVDGKPVERTALQVGDIVRLDVLYLDGSTSIGEDLVGYIGSHGSDEAPAGETLKIYQLQWSDAKYPDFLLRVSRLHTITELPKSAGGGCTYESELKFYGPLAKLSEYFYGERLRAALQKGWVEGLKTRAEKLAAESK